MDMSRNQSSSQSDTNIVPSSDNNSQQGPIGITPQTPKDEEVLKAAIGRESFTNHAPAADDTLYARGSARDIAENKTSAVNQDSIHVSPNQKEGNMPSSMERVDLEYNLGPIDSQGSRPMKRQRLHHDAQTEQPMPCSEKNDASTESINDTLDHQLGNIGESTNGDNVPTRSFAVADAALSEESSSFVDAQSSTKISSTECISKIFGTQKRNLIEAGELARTSALSESGLNEDEIETPRAGASPSKFQSPKVNTLQNRAGKDDGVNLENFISTQPNETHGQLDVKSDISSASSLVESYHEDEESRPFPPAPPSTPATAKDVYQPLLSQLNNAVGSFEYDVDLKKKTQSPTMSNIAVTTKSQPLLPEDYFGDDVATPLPHGISYSAAIAETPREESEGDVTPDIEGSVIERRQIQEHKRNQTKPTKKTDFDLWDVGDRYELKRMLGKGSYGEVAQAVDRHVVALQERATKRQGHQQSESQPELPLYYRNTTSVAVKKISKAFDQEVDAVRLFREMHILRRLRGHECIIQLVDVVQPRSSDLSLFNDLYLVFEYVDTDLYKLIMSPQYLTTEHIQTFLYQMLVGLKYIHSSSGE